jgi:hypothetical protein
MTQASKQYRGNVWTLERQGPSHSLLYWVFERLLKSNMLQRTERHDNNLKTYHNLINLVISVSMGGTVEVNCYFFRAVKLHL